MDPLIWEAATLYPQYGRHGRIQLILVFPPCLKYRLISSLRPLDTMTVRVHGESLADIIVNNETFYYNLESHASAIAVCSSGRPFWLHTAQLCPSHFS